MTGLLGDVAGRLEDEAGLGVMLGHRDEARDKAAAVRAGGTAVERIDGTLAALHRARAALVTEIRQDQDEAAARVDAMLASRA